MPTYDYVCTVCGQRVEVVHSLHGHGPSACSKCGGAMKKAFAPPTVHYKGSGWARKEKAGKPAAKSRGSSGSGDAPPSGDAHASTETSSGSAAEPKPSGDGH